MNTLNKEGNNLKLFSLRLRFLSGGKGSFTGSLLIKEEKNQCCVVMLVFPGHNAQVWSIWVAFSPRFV